jgi:Flp pilus assembly protein TadG
MTRSFAGRRAAGHPKVCLVLSRLRSRRAGRGQTMVEFALLATIFMVVLLVGIQFAIIGQAALAVSQLSYAGARFASLNGSSSDSDIESYIATTLASPSLKTTNGGSSDLTITLSHPDGTTFGQPVTVNISYNAASRILLPNPFMRIPPFFPGISFPTTLTASETAMYETGS